MKYSIQCRYSIVEETFMFLIRDAETQNGYEFTWLLSNIDKPVYVLTNNNIVLKAEMEDNFVMFSVVESEKPLNENLVMTKTVPMLVFETDERQLEIVYDYDHIPTNRDKFVGRVVHEFLEVAGGGFLQNVEDYNKLEKNISVILDEYANNKSDVQPTKTIPKKRTVKKEVAKEQNKTTEQTTEEIKAKTTVKRTRKNTKKSEANQ